MAGREPGAPSIQETMRMQMNAETGAASTSLRYQWQMPTGNAAERAAAANEFPIVPVPKDPYDDTANIKSQYADAGLAGSNWVIPFEQADAQYLLRKRNAQEKAQFDAWVMQKYDITDPAQNMMLQNIAPELFQRREEVIDSQQALVSAYAKLRLRGAKSLSDLELEWLVETGRLELPKGPIWNPYAWRENQQAGYGMTDAEWNAHRYRFGLFAPIRWLTSDQAGYQPKANNPADILGDSRNRYTNPTVPYPAPAWGNVWTRPIPYPGAGSNTHSSDADRRDVQVSDDNARKFMAIMNDSRAAPGRVGQRPPPAPAPAPGRV